MQGKYLCVGNNMRAKKSEYTCGRRPLPCLGGLIPKGSPGFCCWCCCSVILGRDKQQTLKLCWDNYSVAWDCPQPSCIQESWPCCWPQGQLGSASLCRTAKGTSLRKADPPS